MLRRWREARLSQHVGILGEGVGVSLWGCSQHDDAEGGWAGRGDPIGTWNKLYYGDGPSGTQGRVGSLQKPDTIGGVEVVKEIWDKDDVVTNAEIHVESASGDGAKTGFKARGSRVLE